MKKTSVRNLAFGALAFVAGAATMHLAQPAAAAAPPLTAAAIDLSALQPSDLPTPNPASPTLRSRTLAVADGATAAVQIGTVVKHYHADANEIQIVVSGGGTEWLGTSQVALHPGMVLIIPNGTPHGGTTDPNVKIFSVKTPPQAPTDLHPLP